MDSLHLPPILASSSRYRRELLLRICTNVDCIAADIDEHPLPAEPPRQTAMRLAIAKADAIARQHPGRLVIGSDQVAELDGQPLGKPGHRDGAIAQLQACSGRQVRFHTALSLQRGTWQAAYLDTTTVAFRSLSRDEIERYVDHEQPWDCAGSFKVEGLGIALFESVESTDPTALIGLPLIATCRLLRDAGFDPLRR